jgi:hypothetical protein
MCPDPRNPWGAGEHRDLMDSGMGTWKFRAIKNPNGFQWSKIHGDLMEMAFVDLFFSTGNGYDMAFVGCFYHWKWV